ncbi:sigma-70 family RNA polymerase sigma factor [Streptomyces sp. NPDC048644]|uniref:sigma-70 family RNA polymerase sigma factor n=1 Tax=Streptomyces sp. NPDC048644 TaxID=3365582 RepID=UPI003712FEB0
MPTARPSTPRAVCGRPGAARPPSLTAPRPDGPRGADTPARRAVANPQDTRARPAADTETLLRRVVERYRPSLLRYAGRLTSGDPYRAEDIVQETFLRAWLAADRLDLSESSGQDGGEPRLGSWLFTVAHNLAVDAHRRERAVPVGPTPTEVLLRPAGADMADAVIDRCVLTQALHRLSPEHRDVLVHVHLMGRSGAEAAQAMGIPRGTVKSRTHYALLAMRRELAQPPRQPTPPPGAPGPTTRTATNATPPHPAAESAAA